MNIMYRIYVYMKNRIFLVVCAILQRTFIISVFLMRLKLGSKTLFAEACRAHWDCLGMAGWPSYLLMKRRNCWLLYRGGWEIKSAEEKQTQFFNERGCCIVEEGKWNCGLSMWGKIMIPMYRLWLQGLYGLYGPRCPLSPETPLNSLLAAI